MCFFVSFIQGMLLSTVSRLVTAELECLFAMNKPQASFFFVYDVPVIITALQGRTVLSNYLQQARLHVSLDV